MAAVLERAHALRSVADRHFLRTEVIGIEHALQRLGLLERPPIRARARPGAVRAPEGIEAVLRRIATQSLVGHVLDAARAARDQHIAHDALLVDRKGLRIDEVMEVRRLALVELDQARGHGIGRQLDLRLGGHGLAMVAFPIALISGPGAAADDEKSQDEDSQATSAASAARTSAASSTRARYSTWSTPTETPAPSRNARPISGVSSKRRKCTDEV